MKDIITHVQNTKLFVSEVETVFPKRILKDDDGKTIGVDFTDKTPSIKKGFETLAVMRMRDADLAELKQLTTIDVLVEVDVGGDLLAAMTTANRAIYDSVYDQTPFDITLEDGTITTITPSELFGGFA